MLSFSGPEVHKMLQAPTSLQARILEYLPLWHFDNNDIDKLWEQLSFEQLIEPISQGKYKGRDLLWIASNEAGNGENRVFNRLWHKFNKELKCEHFLTVRNGHDEHTAALWSLIPDATNEGFNYPFCNVFRHFRQSIPVNLFKRLAANSPLIWKLAINSGSQDKDISFQAVWAQFQDHIPLETILRLREESVSALWHLMFGSYIVNSTSFELVWEKHKNRIPLTALLNKAGKPSDYEGASCLWLICYEAVKNNKEELFLKIYEHYQGELSIDDFLQRSGDFPDGTDAKPQSALELFMLAEAIPASSDSILHLVLSKTPGLMPAHLFPELEKLGFMPLVNARNEFFMKLKEAKKQPINLALSAELYSAAEKAHNAGYDNAFKDIVVHVYSNFKHKAEAFLENTPTLLFTTNATAQPPAALPLVGEKRKFRHSQ